MKNPWKKLKSKTVYINNWLKVREDKVIRPDGKEGIYSVVDTPPSVFVVALTPNNEIFLVGQYRYTTNHYSLELPAGGSNNENLLESAKRELREETGLEAKTWEQVGYSNPMNGVSSEVSYVFLARGLKETDNNAQKEEGIYRVVKIPLERAFKMIEQGKLRDSQSITALVITAFFLGYKFNKI